MSNLSEAEQQQVEEILSYFNDGVENLLALEFKYNKQWLDRLEADLEQYRELCEDMAAVYRVVDEQKQADAYMDDKEAAEDLLLSIKELQDASSDEDDRLFWRLGEQ